MGIDPDCDQLSRGSAIHHQFRQHYCAGCYCRGSMLRTGRTSTPFRSPPSPLGQPLHQLRCNRSLACFRAWSQPSVLSSAHASSSTKSRIRMRWNRRRTSIAFFRSSQETCSHVPKTKRRARIQKHTGASKNATQKETRAKCSFHQSHEVPCLTMVQNPQWLRKTKPERPCCCTSNTLCDNEERIIPSKRGHRSSFVSQMRASPRCQAQFIF